ncbi:hypothetical protein ACH0B6_00955 [Solibacillus silvestris]
MGEHIEVLDMRKEIYEEAKQKHPECWEGSTRNRTAHEQVASNPTKEVGFY